MVLCEKGVSVDVVGVDPDDRPDELRQINPYNTLPTLLDRDLVLYQSTVIMEYLDERFPHPPLLPVYPVARAQSKLLMHRIEKDWSSAVDLLMSGSGKDGLVDKTRNELRESIAGIAPIFDDRKFFMNEEFSLVDCCVAPILWRLPAIDISLPEKQTKSMQRYMNDMFSREAFIDSLTESELEMRE
tara:strand:+ start:878 stop:1435 length:558 start_codon:yes stop_codon:yes gene_type:complete